jgi:hypothetical protein
MNTVTTGALKLPLRSPPPKSDYSKFQGEPMGLSEAELHESTEPQVIVDLHRELVLQTAERFTDRFLRSPTLEELSHLTDLPTWNVERALGVDMERQARKAKASKIRAASKRWATLVSRIVTLLRGRSMTVSEIAKALGTTYEAVDAAMRKGNSEAKRMLERKPKKGKYGLVWVWSLKEGEVTGEKS